MSYTFRKLNENCKNFANRCRTKWPIFQWLKKIELKIIHPISDSMTNDHIGNVWSERAHDAAQIFVQSETNTSHFQFHVSLFIFKRKLF